MTLKTCIHVFTCTMCVECTHTCTHTALDPTNKNTLFKHSQNICQSNLHTDNILALQHAFYTVLPWGRGSQTEVVLLRPPSTGKVYQAVWGHLWLSDWGCWYIVGGARNAAQLPAVPRMAPYRD